MKFKINILNIFLCLFLFSCAPQIVTVPLDKRSEKNKYTQSSELYSPIYSPNGGVTKGNIFNRAKVQKEREFIALLKSVPKPQEKIKIQNSETDKAMAKAIESYNQKIFELENKISQIDFKKKGNEEEYENLLIELNNLICNYQEGLTLLEKKVQKLYGDVSFKTASSEITGKGRLSIKEIANNIQNDVLIWKNYVNTCNKKIFENELFIVVVNIDGYADQRGDEASNLILSMKRAQAVEKLLRDELVTLVTEKNVKIVFDKIYSEGYGETLPPDIQQGSPDDPNRRICLINYLVGPVRYLGD